MTGSLPLPRGNAACGLARGLVLLSGRLAAEQDEHADERDEAD
jgi:hypothetical protein